MALRSVSSTARQLSRRLSTAAAQAPETATKGPKLPVGNDPGAFHSQEHAVSTLTSPSSRTIHPQREASYQFHSTTKLMTCSPFILIRFDSTMYNCELRQRTQLDGDSFQPCSPSPSLALASFNYRNHMSTSNHRKSTPTSKWLLE